MRLSSLISVLSLSGALSVVQGISVPRANSTYVGTMFIFDPGQGACGFTNTSTQIVASVSRQIFTTFPNATKNPNKNPICKHQVSIFYGGKTLAAPIVDFFTDPNAQFNVGLSLPGFEQFASRDDGIVEGVRWTIVE